MKKAIWYDLSRLARQGRYLWMLALAIALVVSAGNIRLAEFYSLAEQQEYHLSFADLALLLFQGGRAYDPAAGEPFRAPAVWLMEQLFLCILVCRVDVCPHSTLEQSAVLGVRRRRFWWYSKCVTIVCQIAVTYLLQLAVLFIAAPEKTVPFQLSPNTLQQVFELPVASAALGQWAWYVVLLPCLVSMLVGIVQLFLSLLIGALPGMIAVFLYLAAAAFYDSPVLIGRLTMPVRGPLCGAGNAFDAASLALLALAALLCLWWGQLRFETKNLI